MAFYIYVISLKPEVIQSRKFRDANPNYIEGKPCYYVGYSSLKPSERALQHQLAIRNANGPLYSRLAHKYFNGLTRRYQSKNPIATKEEAMHMEEYVAGKLRSQGCGVWWN